MFLRFLPRINIAQMDIARVRPALTTEQLHFDHGSGR
jgi:hypothetical protein